jgi:hypothetical protein
VAEAVRVHKPGGVLRGRGVWARTTALRSSLRVELKHMKSPGSSAGAGRE